MKLLQQQVHDKVIIVCQWIPKPFPPKEDCFFFVFFKWKTVWEFRTKEQAEREPAVVNVPTVVPVANWYSASLNTFRFVVALSFALWPLECSEANCFWSQGQSSVCSADVSESLGRREGWFACFSGCRVPSRKGLTFFLDFSVWPWESTQFQAHRHSYCYSRCRRVQNTVEESGWRGNTPRGSWTEESWWVHLASCWWETPLPCQRSRESYLGF